MTHIDSNDRLTSLRARMESAGLDVFLVPMADEYQSEYVPDCARRVAFLSGFTGSAGFIVVTRDRAAFFTDSRYTLQASQQVSSQSFVLFDSAQKTPYVWMEEALAKGARVGFDPWLHCAASVERLKKALAKVEAVAVPTDENLVDAIWAERPLPPAAPFQTHSLSYAGKPSEDKRTLIAADLKKRNLAAAIITDPASVAWLLNIRGGDVPNTPLPLSRAIIYDDARVQLFADAIKIKDGMAAHLGPQVSIFEPSRLADALDTLARTGRPILLDPEHAASWIVDCLRAAGGKIEHGDDPCELPRACKNTAEVEGMRAAHRRDGAALAKFFAWLERSWPNGDVTELSVEEKLEIGRAHV
jgi:Xaa-Pro aminopeptidase